MSKKTFNTRIKIKRDTAANWEANNPVLLNGEEILVDTNAGEVRKKIGDGTKQYNQLPFADETIRNLISNKVDKVSGKSLSTNDYTTTEKTKLANIAEKANNYTHPSYMSKTSGLYKITVDSTGHVSGTSAVTKSDITALGIPSSDTNTHYTSKNVVGSNTATSDTTEALTNGNVYLVSVENGVVTSAHKISGSGATTVTTDENGNIIISSTDTNTTYSVATTSANGLMSSSDKTKLNGIATGANAYTHPTTSGNKHIPSGGSSGQILRWSSDGTAVWGADNNTTYSTFKAATSSAAGGTGLVPAPAAGKQTSFLRGDGTWVVPTNTTYSNMTAATSSAAGKAGLVPAPAAGKQNSFLRGDGTWQTPTLNIDAIYPVGSVKISINNVNPQTYITGTTWTQFGQGRVLIGQGTGNDGSTSMSFTAESQGGEYTHTLTTSEMPVHTHTGKPQLIQNTAVGSSAFGYISNGAWDSVESSGNGEAHNNMPPYFVVFLWRRTK